MKILLIITPFYPSQTPNTLRWMPIIEYYANKGIETTVLTTKNRVRQNDNIAMNTEVHHAGYNTLLDWLYFTLFIKRRRHLPNQDHETSSTGYIAKFTEWIVDRTWRQYYWPDGSQLFLKPGVQRAQDIIQGDNKITHVISVGLPFTCHLIAYELKKVFPRLHWHQDIEDPFSYSDKFRVNNIRRYRDRNIEAEQKAFRLSDSISVTNPKAKILYDRLFPDQAHKQSVIYPMFSGFNVVSNLDIELDTDKIHVAYFGSFYENVRSPEPLLQILQILSNGNYKGFQKIHFHFFGQQNRFSTPIFNSYNELQGQIILHGLKDRDYCIEVMVKMDYLINIGNTTDYHLPSKVVDFLYSNKPLINILSSKDDAALPLLKDKIEMCNLFINEVDKRQLAEKLYLFICKERVESQVSEDNITQYKTEVIAEQYLKAMNLR